MKKVIIITLTMAVSLGILGNRALAIKVVPKSNSDSSHTKTPPPVPIKPAETATGQPSTRPSSSGQKSNEAVSSEIPQPPRDKFIDRDNDGINDDIKRHQEPQIKRDRAEPARPIEIPKRSEPAKKNEEPKGEEKKVEAKKH
jgi:hypothetical protein